MEFWRLGECNVGSETPRLSVAKAILSILWILSGTKQERKGPPMKIELHRITVRELVDGYVIWSFTIF